MVLGYVYQQWEMLQVKDLDGPKATSSLNCHVNILADFSTKLLRLSCRNFSDLEVLDHCLSINAASPSIGKVRRKSEEERVDGVKVKVRDTNSSVIKSEDLH